MKKKTISFKVSEEEALLLEQLSKQANMTQSDYIRHSIMNNSIEVIDRSRSLYIALRKIGDSIDKEEQHLPKPDFDVIREEVFQTCQLLKP